MRCNWRVSSHENCKCLLCFIPTCRLLLCRATLWTPLAVSTTWRPKRFCSFRLIAKRYLSWAELNSTLFQSAALPQQNGRVINLFSKTLLAYGLSQVFLLWLCSDNNIIITVAKQQVAINRGIAREGAGVLWAPIRSQSPLMPTMKWHCIQGSMGSCHFESQSAP